MSSELRTPNSMLMCLSFWDRQREREQLTSLYPLLDKNVRTWIWPKKNLWLEHFQILRDKTKQLLGQHGRGSWRRLQVDCVRGALAVVGMQTRAREGWEIPLQVANTCYIPGAATVTSFLPQWRGSLWLSAPGEMVMAQVLPRIETS